MSRKARREPEWAVDEEKELLRDAEMADRYRFYSDDITAARHDLETFSWTFHNNPFKIYEKSANSIKVIARKLEYECECLDKLNNNMNSSLLATSIAEIRHIIRKLDYLRSNLPRRSHSLQTISVMYLMAFWYHTIRLEGYDGPRDVVNSFNGDQPSHKSMKFIVEMLNRCTDPQTKNTSKSTITRSVKLFQVTKPRPDEVHPFEGDASFLN
ncbi:hypothetical protein MMMDOFMJ_4556 [Methylobacterium gnaphalii]|uniref:Uncharacterized protein n=1 Tax=Methylobacterium gnaphalii TaxID=1010610 RepID=A0A512JQ80_9HYPH|nr:hypothetical protein MGN01_38580 [Methylobacterium gnaphalii]GJD71593.1 hypothetical protein MMMDOFMJ_4556 [Methylobacterium gnaphalii]